MDNENLTKLKRENCHSFIGEKLCELFETSGEGIVIINEHGRIIHSNPQITVIFGYSPDELKGKPLKMLFSERYSEILSRQYSQLIAANPSSQSNVALEYSGLHKNGTEFPVEMSISISHSQDKQHLMAFIIDASSNAQTRLQLEKTKAEFESIYYSLPGAVIFTSQERKIVRVNPSFSYITGYSFEEVEGKTTEFLYAHYSDFIEHGDKHFNPAAERDTRSYEIFYRRKDGTTFPGRTVGSPVRNHYGQTIGFIKIISDISEHRKLRDEFNQFFKLSLDLICIIGFDGYLRQINPSWITTLGYDEKELFSRPFIDFVHPDDVESSWKEIKILLSGQPADGIENRFICKDGTVKWLSWRHVADPKHKVVYGIARDITEYKETLAQMKKINEELEKARQAADAANQTKSQFLANMSHEIRTPLNAIIGFSDLLMESNLKPEEQEYTRYIRNSSQHLMMLINDILDLSRVESGKMEIEENAFDIWEMVKETVDLMKPRVQEKKLKVKFFIDEDIPDILLGDEKHIRQILINLLSNAVKFTRKGTVSIYVTNSDTLPALPGTFPISIIIKDTGIGISPDKLQTIFEPFDRGEESSERTHEGTGLGLSITRRFVELLGGTIEVESIPGEGSTFSVDIPMKVVPAEDKDEQEASEIPMTSGGYREFPTIELPIETVELPMVDSHTGPRILLVEDNHINQRLIQAYLKNTGYHISTAFDGIEAVEKARQEPYDLVLMDIQLPKMDGYEATRQLRKMEAYREKPIIALTAHAMKNDDTKAQEAGCSGYLTKPIQKTTLLETISRNLSQEYHKAASLPEKPRQRNIDPDIVELIPWFKEYLKETLAEAQQALAKGDTETLKIKGHQLKGQGTSFGYDEITEIGATIEIAAIDEDQESLSFHLRQLDRTIQSIMDEK